MANYEVEQVLKRVDERAAERRRQKQAERLAVKEKHGNLFESIIAYTERTLQSAPATFRNQCHEGSLPWEAFTEWSEAQRAESRAKLMNEFLARP